MFVCVLAIQSRFNLNRILSGSLLLPLPSSSSLWCALVDALDIVKYERCVGTTWQTKNFMNTQKRKKHIFLFHNVFCVCVKGKKLFFSFKLNRFICIVWKYFSLSIFDLAVSPSFVNRIWNELNGINIYHDLKYESFDSNWIGQSEWEKNSGVANRSQVSDIHTFLLLLLSSIALRHAYNFCYSEADKKGIKSFNSQ